MTSAFERVARLLEASRNDDNGFGPRPGLDSEPEPTALVGLALGDELVRRWLAVNQHSDGSFRVVSNPLVNDSATSAAVLALAPGPARVLALDYLERHQGTLIGGQPETDPRGWSWTKGTWGWVEPTARATLALKLLRPSATSAIRSGVGALERRECKGGGWNVGGVEAYDIPLEPYRSTTAWGLLALQGRPAALYRRGLKVLRAFAPVTDGTMTAALTLLALRLAGDERRAAEQEAALEVLVEQIDPTDFDMVAVAWAAVATGPAHDLLEVRA